MGAQNLDSDITLRREERGSSFCDISSSKSSIRIGSNSSLILEDDGSDAGASSDCLSNGGDRHINHSTEEDYDLEAKIKWFFQSIEQQEAEVIDSDECKPVTSSTLSDSTIVIDTSFTFSSNDSEGHSKLSASSTDSLLGKRASTTVSATSKRSKHSSEDV